MEQESDRESSEEFAGERDEDDAEVIWVISMTLCGALALLGIVAVVAEGWGG